MGKDAPFLSAQIHTTTITKPLEPTNQPCDGQTIGFLLLLLLLQRPCFAFILANESQLCVCVFSQTWVRSQPQFGQGCGHPSTVPTATVWTGVSTSLYSAHSNSLDRGVYIPLQCPPSHFIAQRLWIQGEDLKVINFDGEFSLLSFILSPILSFLSPLDSSFAMYVSPPKIIYPFYLYTSIYCCGYTFLSSLYHKGVNPLHKDSTLMTELRLKRLHLKITHIKLLTSKR